MAKSSGQKLKILYLKDILLRETDEEHPILMPDLIRKLEAHGIKAERKSLYDDINTLIEYGLEVEFREKKPSGYFVGSRKFDTPEVKVLIDSVISSKFINEKKTRDLVKKLATLCSQHEANLMQRQVYTPEPYKTMADSTYFCIDIVHDCISRKEQVSFKYKGYNLDKGSEFKHGGKRYQVSPYALLRDNENYYMVSYDSEAEKIKHFRIDRMAEPQFTGKPREGETVMKDIDLNRYTTENFAMYSGDDVKVCLRFSNDLIDVAIDRFGQDISIRKSGPGHFEIWVTVIVSPQFYGWLFGLGSKVTVVRPDSVRQGLLEHLQGFLDAQGAANASAIGMMGNP